MSVLRIESSINAENSVSRALTDRIIASLGATEVVTRDLAASPPPLITTAWAQARVIPAEDRSPADNAALALSNALVAELKAAETLVIGLPIYNFSVPASLKAWLDLVARVGETFRYTAEGPQGLLEGKRAIVAVASGGTRVGSDIDFATGYLRHMLGFMGITDVEFIAADAMAIEPEETLAAAHAQIETMRVAA